MRLPSTRFEAVNKYIFTTAIAGSGDGAVIAGFIASMPNVKRIAIVKARDDGRTEADALLENLDKKFEIVANEQIDRRVTDAVTQAIKLKEQSGRRCSVHLPRRDAVLTAGCAKVRFGCSVYRHYLGHGFARSCRTRRCVDVVKILRRFVPDRSTWRARGDKMGRNLPSQLSAGQIANLVIFGMSGALLIVDALNEAGKDLTRENSSRLWNDERPRCRPAFCKISMSPEIIRDSVRHHVDARGPQNCPVAPTWKAINNRIKFLSIVGRRYVAYLVFIVSV